MRYCYHFAYCAFMIAAVNEESLGFESRELLQQRLGVSDAVSVVEDDNAISSAVVCRGSGCVAMG